MSESDSQIDPVRALVDVLRDRRSRRFGLGMRMESGPLAYSSTRTPLPLSEEEEGLLAFAACGITGHALGDLVYAPGGGGEIMAGLSGRTIPSGDAIHTVSVFVVNPDGTYLLRRPRDFDAREIDELVEMARSDRFVDLYRRSRIRLSTGRAAPPLDNFFNLSVNKWSLYDPAATYFLPLNDLTLLYINGVLEIFKEENGGFIVDERALYRPAAREPGRCTNDAHTEALVALNRVHRLDLRNHALHMIPNPVPVDG